MARGFVRCRVTHMIACAQIGEQKARGARTPQRVKPDPAWLLSPATEKCHDLSDNAEHN